jgi:hypothetical protein
MVNVAPEVRLTPETVATWLATDTVPVDAVV